ncbi:MAG: hypothetical protein ABH864_00125 [archaeon]
MTTDPAKEFRRGVINESSLGRYCIGARFRGGTIEVTFKRETPQDLLEALEDTYSDGTGRYNVKRLLK